MEYFNDTTENCCQLLGTTFLVLFYEIYLRFNDVPKMEETFHLNFIETDSAICIYVSRLIDWNCLKHIKVYVFLCVAFITLNILEAYLF